MNKSEFLSSIQSGLRGLPKEDIEERLSFYSEMIDDQIEEGLSEEEAVAEIGTADGVLSQILSEIPLSRLVKESVKPKRALKAWEIVLLVLTSPVWVSLLIAAFVIIISAYIVIWSLLISVWSIELVFSLGSVYIAANAVVFISQSRFWQCMAYFGASIAFVGIAILMFFVCKKAFKGAIVLTKKITESTKLIFIRKRVAK